MESDPKKPPPDREREVNGEMAQLACAVGGLEKMIDGLESRLAPILSQSEPESASADSEKQVEREAPLALELQGLSRRVALATLNLLSVLKRLEII